jgi:hypothetical protein
MALHGEPGADYPEFIDGEAVEGNASESENDAQNESESTETPPPPLYSPPDRAARRRVTQAMFNKARENGAIIDSTTVFTFTQQPQSSAMSTTTTYDATFLGEDGRPKKVFVGLFRAASGGGNPSTRKIPHTSHMPALYIYAHHTTHTQPGPPCAGWGPSWRMQWAHGETPNWKSTFGFQAKPVSNNDVDPDNRFVHTDFYNAIDNLTKAALQKAAGHCNDLRAWFFRTHPAMSTAPPNTVAYAHHLFALDIVTPDMKPHQTIGAPASRDHHDAPTPRARNAVLMAS